MSDLTRLSAAELAGSIAAGEVSALEVTEAHLERIAQVDGAVHAFLHVDTDGAMHAAKQVDARRAAGGDLGPLAGVPLAMKDVVVTRGLPSTAGSKILEGWVPPYDATISTRIKDAGIVMLGKTNMDEFAMGSSTENSAYGPTHNPWDLTRIPGGSSGGSSAAVAAFEAPLAIGTDTGGSIRQPAAVTGTVGFKPTYGAVSRYGLIAFSSSLDQAGPFARTVLDAALLYEAIGGHDPCDSTSIPRPVAPAVSAARDGASGDLSGVRIGVVRELERRGLRGGRARVLRRGGDHAEGAGRRDRRGVVPALPVRAAGVLPDRAERVLVQPGPLRLGALRTARRRRRGELARGRHVADPRGRLRRRGEAAHHDRHLRAVVRATTTRTTARRRRSAR